MNNSTDVIVVGGGVFGLSSAYVCALRGLQVVVLDKEIIGGGASGGIVGALAPHVPDNWNEKKQFQFQSLDSSEAFWKSVDAHSNQDSGYGRIGRLVPIISEKNRTLAEARIVASQKHWQGRYQWAVEGSSVFINADSAPFGVIKDSLSARLYPAKAISSLKQACKNLGVEIRENTHVSKIEHHCVSGQWGQLSASAIVIAGGVDGFGLLNPFEKIELGAGVKGQAALLKIDLQNMPQIFADGIYIVPHDNGTVAVGSTSEKTWADPIAVDEKLDDILVRARKICPAIKDALIIQKWAGIRPMARRRDPMLGPFPHLNGVFLAMGAFKIGFGIAPKVGETIADFVQCKEVVMPESFTFNYHLK